MKWNEKEKKKKMNPSLNYMDGTNKSTVVIALMPICNTK
jgi:hypothetical protein